jgi:hypothetical protein
MLRRVYPAWFTAGDLNGHSELGRAEGLQSVWPVLQVDSDDWGNKENIRGTIGTSGEPIVASVFAS